MQSFMILVTNKPYQSTASELYASLDISVLLDAYSTEDARARWSFHFRRVGNIHTTLFPTSTFISHKQATHESPPWDQQTDHDSFISLLRTFKLSIFASFASDILQQGKLKTCGT